MNTEQPPLFLEGTLKEDEHRQPTKILIRLAEIYSITEILDGGCWVRMKDHTGFEIAEPYDSTKTALLNLAVLFCGG